MDDLYQKLNGYFAGGDYPFHMPGHKRQMAGYPMEAFYSIDITEIPGFDDLHHPKEILKDISEGFSRLYGSDTTYLMVNGSTGGILSAIGAASPAGGEILAARNCHQSVYNGAAIAGLKLRYMYPPVLTGDFCVFGSIPPQSVKEALDGDGGYKIKAVIITSPTYDGVVSDVEAITAICHKKGVPIIVDAAHGAHFVLSRPDKEKEAPGKSFLLSKNDGAIGTGNISPQSPNSCKGSDSFPMDAVRAGADIVIHSLHKTLPSLTQTALLHVQGSLIDRERLEFFLSAYQSSSPSYILMASMGECLRIMREEGDELCKGFFERLAALRNSPVIQEGVNILGFKNNNMSGRPRKEGVGKKIHPGQKNEGKVTLYPGCAGTPYSDCDSSHSGKELIYGLDPGKLLIHAPCGGPKLFDKMVRDYKLVPEMAAPSYVTLILSVMDKNEGFDRLERALIELSKTDWQRITQSGTIPSSINPAKGEGKVMKPECSPKYPSINTFFVENPSEIVYNIGTALEKDCENVPLKEAVGRVSGGFIRLYPPGVPLVCPGELITLEACSLIYDYRELGLNVQGISIKEDKLICKVLK